LIYLDTSVALAHLLAEDRALPERLWQEPLISSRADRVRDLDANSHAQTDAIARG
jgi:hypothetical protein